VAGVLAADAHRARLPVRRVLGVVTLPALGDALGLLPGGQAPRVAATGTDVSCAYRLTLALHYPLTTLVMM
jgi:hypothetical protein